MEFPKITAKLPRLPGRGFFTVRHTAPGTQAPLGIVDAFPGRFDWAAILVMKQKSSCQDGQHPVEPLKVQNSVECEPAQVGGVLLVPGGVVYRTGVPLRTTTPTARPSGKNDKRKSPKATPRTITKKNRLGSRPCDGLLFCCPNWFWEKGTL